MRQVNRIKQIVAVPAVASQLRATAATQSQEFDLDMRVSTIKVVESLRPDGNGATGPGCGGGGSGTCTCGGSKGCRVEKL